MTETVSTGAGPAFAEPTKFAALLVMAGRGERFGAALPKVFAPLVGRPLWHHAAQALSTTPGCELLVLVTAEDRVEAIRAELSGIVDVRVVAGGARRQDSVRAGLTAVPPEIGIVAIHDAARPLVRRETIRAVVDAAAQTGAAIAAAPARDTLKRVDADGRIVGTLDRSDVWLAQTPQAFRTELLRAAHADAHDRGVEATDDAALAELAGAPVRVVPSDPWNIKITEPGDLAVATGLLAARELARQSETP